MNFRKQTKLRTPVFAPLYSGRTSQAPRVNDDGGDGGGGGGGTKFGGGKKASDQGTGGIRDAMQSTYDGQTTGKSSGPDTNNDGISEFSI